MRPFDVTLMVLVGMTGTVWAEAGLVAQWTLAEGQGDAVQDSSGNNAAGRVHEANWTDCGTGRVLMFDAAGAYIDCGHPPSLDLRGPVTIEAWVYPTARPDSETGIAGKSFDRYALTAYGDGNFWWYIGSGANKCRTAANIKYWNHLAGTFDGETMRLYLNGVLKDSIASQFKTIEGGGDFFIGRITHAVGGSPTQSFKGAIGTVRVHDRALSEEEIRARYEAEKGGYRRLETGLDRLLVKPYCYFDEGVAYVDLDFGNYSPLAKGRRATLALWKQGADAPLSEVAVDSIPETGVARDLKLDLKGIAAGEYEVRARIVDENKTVAEARSGLAYPLPAAVPGPQEKMAPPLPGPVAPVPYRLKLDEAGGFEIRFGKEQEAAESICVESSFSFPGGGENALAASASLPPGAEPAWKPTITGQEGPNPRVKAAGAHYAVERAISVEPHRVLVRDTITNVSGAALGIMLSNHFRREGLGKEAAITQRPNPTMFLSKGGRGLGMAALDDVYLEQCENFTDPDTAGLRTNIFALDAGAAYTLEWAVYATGTEDYYDFINAVRKDEGLVRTVEGGFAFMDRREAPSREFVAVRGLKYLSIPCLSHAADDPGISIEGIEFVEYPKECALLRETFAETRRRFPDVKVMFHVAHSLYPTNRPQELFPDSRTINASGKQTDYGDNNIPYYLNYFSKQHVDEGYRWFIFYPAKDNAFGKAMLNAVDFMMDKIGVTGMFADGFTHGYGGRFTYDRWDGHTGEIDPKTKSLTRKYASVNLLAQDVLIAVARRINEKGGVVIANSYPGTRTLNRENVLYCVESGGGDASLAHLHLAPTVIALGDPGRIHSERDLYEDIRVKLKWGALYFYYGEGQVTRPTAAAEMYPITVEKIHSGTITGKERLITLNSGTYGWAQDRSLHFVYHYDGRGVRAPHAFITTVDGNGARTAVDLGENEMAVIKKIPVALHTTAPINLVVQRYDGTGIEVLMNGSGEASFAVGAGEFPLKTGTSYRVVTESGSLTPVLQNNALQFTVSIHGPAHLRIETEAARPS